MKRHPLSTESAGIRQAYVIGYQECLRDIADKFVNEGPRGVAQWISDNYQPTEHVRAAAMPNPEKVPDWSPR